MGFIFRQVLAGQREVAKGALGRSASAAGNPSRPSHVPRLSSFLPPCLLILFTNIFHASQLFTQSQSRFLFCHSSHETALITVFPSRTFSLSPSLSLPHTPFPPASAAPIVAGR